MSNRVKTVIGGLATNAVWATAFPFSRFFLGQSLLNAEKGLSIDTPSLINYSILAKV